ncbi:PAS domain-containing protein [Haloterrigena alkaliphila]|uniref:histidine kinase n=1 Tax=Haloterrigena alkaliphila TaxID=2816475 RepID=A0A8A2VCT8_9EURY|nr:PAS domain-containing protein [Haloterrigena alkaliphila]QSW99839.1 PAS domain-containing protein [Haloterrigena alkaliphila]
MSERADATGGGFWGDVDESAALQRYRTLVSTIDDGLYQLDAEGNFVAVNDIIVETTGFARDDLLGEHVSLVLDDDDLERIEREIREELSTDRDAAGVFEVSIETADGRRVPIELRVSPLIEDGTFRGTVGVARDVSDRKQRQARIETTRGSYETLTSVLDEADVGVFVLDESFDVAWADETAGEYFGFDRDAAIGRDKRELIEEEIRDRVADGDAFADTVLATYDDNSYDERFDCHVTPGPDREERWLEHRSRPIESGRYAGGRVELYYDVTDDHRRAEQLRRLNEAVGEWLEESSRAAVAERALDHLRDILGMTLNGIYLYDADAAALRPASWTEATERLLGDLPTFEPNEGIAWRVFESGEPAFYADVGAAPDAYDPDTPIGSEMVLPIGDHGVAFISSEKRDAFDEGDQMIARVVASSLEATFDRFRHERRLERERDLTDRILDTIPVGGLVLDADGEVTRINDRAAEIFDVDDPESFSLQDRRIYDEEGRRLAADEYPSVRALETGESVSDRVLQVERPDSNRRWLSINAVPIADERGEIDRIVTAGEDITELKERQRVLESELSEVFGRISDAFYALDEEGRFTHVNDRAADLLEVTEDELLGERLEDVFPGTAETQLTRERLDAAMERQEPINLEHYSERLGFWIEATLYPSESGVSVYFRDVTERREYRRKLEESNERLEQFAYAVSHDLQEPLRMVSSYLKLLEDRYGDELGDDGREFVEFAVDGAERMTAMIDGLLEYSRVTTRGDPLEPIDLERVVDDVLADLQFRIEDHDAEITVEDLPRVEGDADQLRQVFQNLLDNAIEYSGDEPPRIRVDAERNGDMWTVSVADEGIGIDPDDTDRIFEVFERLHTREEHEGTGIGLALCKRIVERHDGELWVESEPDEGTTFSFTLPAVDGTSDDR